MGEREREVRMWKENNIFVLFFGRKCVKKVNIDDDSRRSRSSKKKKESWTEFYHQYIVDIFIETKGICDVRRKEVLCWLFLDGGILCVRWWWWDGQTNGQESQIKEKFCSFFPLLFRQSRDFFCIVLFSVFCFVFSRSIDFKTSQISIRSKYKKKIKKQQNKNNKNKKYKRVVTLRLLI